MVAPPLSRWRRSFDKIAFLSPGISLQNQDGRDLVLFLNQTLNREELIAGLSGVEKSDQFFMPGYPLHDANFQKNIKIEKIPERFRTTPIRVLTLEGRLPEFYTETLEKVFTAATGVKPEIIHAPIDKIPELRRGNSFDLLFISIAINDTNVDSLVSYVFGANPPIVANASNSDSGNFQKRVASAKDKPDQLERNLIYKKVFAEAIESGCILPLFLFSTEAVAKGNLDLSKVPENDETAAFDKVRFR